MVDWSLQSPSLHCYFRNEFKNWSGEAEGTESKLDRQPGLFDLFVEIEALVSKLGSQAASPDNTLNLLEPDRFVIPTDIPSLSLLKAGRLDGSFFASVTVFTPSRQSLLGSVDVARLALDYR